MTARVGKRGMLDWAVDLVWPPRSLLSDALVSRPGAIEPELWSRLDFLSDQCCFRCGFPFETAVEGEALCGACAAKAPAYHRARAALAYDDLSRRLVLDLKRAGRCDGLGVYAAWMKQAGADLVAEADVLAPVPLHWTRLLSRRFNQAAWLAQALGRAARKPVLYAALKRVRARKSQAGLNPDQRRRNVAGAFRASPESRKLIEGRAVLLIDDVFTTGATAEACARALKRVGAARTDVLTLSRVVRPADALI